MMPFAVTWMIILSEITQRKTYITYMWSLKKKMVQMNLFTKRNRLTDLENRLVAANGERMGG